MKRKIITGIVFVLFMLVVSLPMNAGAQARGQNLFTIGTHPTGTLHNSLGMGIATVLDGALPQRFNVLAVSGPGEWGPLLKTGEADFGVANNWDSQMAWLGGSVYGAIDKDGFPLRVIFKTLFFQSGLVVAKDSGIRTFQDLKGKRVVTEFTAAPGSAAFTLAALAIHGLSESDVRGISVPSLGAGVNAVKEGRADAAYAATGMGVVTELDATRGALFLSFDPTPENWAKGDKIIRSIPVAVVPREGLVAIEENPTYLQGYRSYFLGREDLSEEFVYSVVKAFVENIDKFKEIHAQFRRIDLKSLVGPGVTVPYHDGAIKYFKEIGLWTPEIQASQDELLKAKK